MKTVLSAIIVFLFATGPAYAYVDPGTASIALQAIIGGLAAGGLFFRARIASFLGMIRRRGQKGDDADTSETAGDGRRGEE